MSDSSEKPALPATTEEDEPSATPAGRLLVQFFIVPFFVVAVAVFVFWIFGSIAVDRKNAVELLADVRTASRNQRWQSAFELTRRLPNLSDPAARSSFVAETIRTYEGARNDDPRVRRYLALILGRLGDPRAVPVLEGSLEDKDAETRLYALWGLALIGNPSSATKVRPLLSSEDPGVRKTAAFAAGRMEDGEAVPELRKLLSDTVMDVRWNAALALAALDDPAGKDVLLSMTDRPSLQRVAGLTTEQVDDALLNGVKGLALLKDPAARTLGDRLRASDPSLRVRKELPAILASLKP